MVLGVRLLSLTIVFSRVICLVAYKHLILFYDKVTFHYMDISWFICSHTEHIDSFQILTIMYELLKMFVCSFLYGHMFSTPVGKYQAA